MPRVNQKSLTEGCCAGSIGRVCNSSAWGHELEPHIVGWHYLKKILTDYRSSFNVYGCKSFQGRSVSLAVLLYANFQSNLGAIDSSQDT